MAAHHHSGRRRALGGRDRLALGGRDRLVLGGLDVLVPGLCDPGQSWPVAVDVPCSQLGQSVARGGHFLHLEK